MTITSIGYDGTVQEGPWAKLSRLLGNTYAASGFAVTIGGTSDRAVTVGTGDAYGYGVLDTNSATINLNAASVSSGSRWDTVVVSRNWSTNTTTAAIRTGTGTKAISASLTHTPGTTDDQPIALIRSTAGQTAVQELVDLRPQVQRPAWWADDTIVPDPTWFGYGEAITKVNPPGSGQVDVLTRVGSTGSERWLPLTAPHADGGSVLSDLSYNGGPSGLIVFGGQTPWFTRAGGRFELGGALANRSGNLLANTPYAVATISSTDRPRRDQTFTVAVSFGGVSQSGHVKIDASTGALSFTPAEDCGWFTLDGISWLPKGN